MLYPQCDCSNFLTTLIYRKTLVSRMTKPTLWSAGSFGKTVNSCFIYCSKYNFKLQNELVFKNLDIFIPYFIIILFLQSIFEHSEWGLWLQRFREQMSHDLHVEAHIFYGKFHHTYSKIYKLHIFCKRILGLTVLIIHFFSTARVVTPRTTGSLGDLCNCLFFNRQGNWSPQWNSHHFCTRKCRLRTPSSLTGIIATEQNGTTLNSISFWHICSRLQWSW